MSNKGRLPASGLGAKRPEQHRLFARSHKLMAIRSFLLSLSLSLSPSSLSTSLPHSSCSVSTKGFPRLSSPILTLPLSPLLCLSATRTPLARSISHLQPPRTSSASWPMCHQLIFRVIFSICFHRLRVSSMSPSDRRRRFRLQALPGSSASKTPLLVFDTLALFCLACILPDLGPSWRALQRTRCRT